MTTTIEQRSAQEIVAQYLASRRIGGRSSNFAEVDNVIADATRAIVENMPDGFSRRDVIACVKAYTRDEATLADVKPYRRAFVAGKCLADMVEKRELAENDGVYMHVAF